MRFSLAKRIPRRSWNTMIAKRRERARDRNVILAIGESARRFPLASIADDEDLSGRLARSRSFSRDPSIEGTISRRFPSSPIFYVSQFLFSSLRLPPFLSPRILGRVIASSAS